MKKLAFGAALRGLSFCMDFETHDAAEGVLEPEHKVNVVIAKANELSYWPGTHNLKAVQAAVQGWPEHALISIHKGTKIISKKGEADRHVGAWGLRCDTCFTAYGSETSRNRYSSSQRPTREALLTWVSETGSFTRKKDKWTFHLATHAHRALATNIADAQASGHVRRSMTTQERITCAVRCVFRLVLYIAQQRRPLSDVNDLRLLHVLNGNSDLSLDPKIGVLSDPSANYSSETVIAEMLQIAAEVCHEETATMLERASVHAFTLHPG